MTAMAWEATAARTRRVVENFMTIEDRIQGYEVVVEGEVGLEEKNQKIEGRDCFYNPRRFGAPNKVQSGSLNEWWRTKSDENRASLGMGQQIELSFFLLL